MSHSFLNSSFSPGIASAAMSNVRPGLRSLALVSALLFASSAAMADATREPTLQDIVSQQRTLRTQVVGGKGAFKDMERRDRDELAKRQQRVIDMLAGVNSLDELRAEQRTDVFNELEWIKAVIVKAEDDRMVCEYSNSVGSHRPTSKCMTARQQREYRERSQDQVRRGATCNSSSGTCTGD